MLLNCGVGEDSWESLGLQRDPPVHPKGDQSWIFIGRTDVEVETPVFWPPDMKNWLIWKDPDAGKDWRQEKKGTTEDEMVGWHYWLNGHEFESAPGVVDRQGGLACCSPWGRKDSDTTEQLNWTELHTLLRRTVYLLHICVALLLTQEGMKVGSSGKFIFTSSLYSLLSEIYTSLLFCLLLLFCLRS